MTAAVGDGTVLVWNSTKLPLQDWFMTAALGDKIVLVLVWD